MNRPRTRGPGGNGMNRVIGLLVVCLWGCASDPLGECLAICETQSSCEEPGSYTDCQMRCDEIVTTFRHTEFPPGYPCGVDYFAYKDCVYESDFCNADFCAREERHWLDCSERGITWTDRAAACNECAVELADGGYGVCMIDAVSTCRYGSACWDQCSRQVCDCD